MTTETNGTKAEPPVVKGPDLEAIAKLDPKRGLVTKLAEVMGAVHRIPKTGYNSHFGYAFATEADVTEAVRAELAARHVILVPRITDRTVEERKGERSTSFYTVLKLDLEFADGDNGQTLTFPAIGESLDTQDKGTSKAYTAALKYALLKFFLIPTGDDPDSGPSRRQAEEASTLERSRAQAAQQDRQRPGSPRPARQPIPPARPHGGPQPGPDGFPLPTSQHTRPTERNPLDPTTQRLLVEEGEKVGLPAKEFVSQWITAHGYRGWGDFLEHGGADGGILLVQLQDKFTVRDPLPA